MAKTRRAKSSSPSSRLRAPRETLVQGSILEPRQPLVVPPSIQDAPLSSPMRRYETRRPPTTLGASSSRAKKSGSHPPKKKANVSTPFEPSEPPSEPQPPQPPATESQILSGMTPEVVIRRPMVTQPPIEGNLDCKAKPFHFELCFDTDTFRLQPKLRDSFHLLQRYHMEHLMTPRDFFYPRVALDFYPSMTTHHVRDPTVIHSTIDGRHGILGARHIAKALRIPYETAHPKDYRVWTHPSQSVIVHILSRGASTCQYLLRKELPPSMFFIDALLHHNIYPLQHMIKRIRYPSEPHFERRHICREIFTLDKWMSMTTYNAKPGAPVRPEHPEIPHPEHPEEPQPVEMPTDMRAPALAVPSTEPIPEVAPSAPPATLGTPPVILSTSEPSPLPESRIAISISEFRGLCHTLQALTTSQSILTQQMTALRAHQE
uniref:Uncharacterized protein n=1 Tax=Vitis vinifera TaxID=29760 RepID=A5BHS4_VITVI|nr:hypothetical protein VITISV_032652 [Vitis vinifera]